MKDNNSGIKVTLVILVLICLMQGCSITDLENEIRNMDSRMQMNYSEYEQLQMEFYDLKEELESEMEIDIDFNYEIVKMDWNAGVMNVDFVVNPINITENTKIILSNGANSIELVKQNNSFVGTLNYPIDSNNHETTLYQYEGDYVTLSGEICSISAMDWATENAYCELFGYQSYGNDKLTLAGDLGYYLYTDEKIETVNLVLGEKYTELDKNAEGKMSLNMSEYVGKYTNEDVNAQEFYVEYVMESGVVYRLCPAVFAGASYNVEMKEEDDIISMETKFENYFSQENQITIIDTSGKEYDIMLYVE